MHVVASQFWFLFFFPSLLPKLGLRLKSTHGLGRSIGRLVGGQKQSRGVRKRVPEDIVETRVDGQRSGWLCIQSCPGKWDRTANDSNNFPTHWRAQVGAVGLFRYWRKRFRTGLGLVMDSQKDFWASVIPEAPNWGLMRRSERQKGSERLEGKRAQSLEFVNSKKKGTILHE